MLNAMCWIEGQPPVLPGARPARVGVEQLAGRAEVAEVTVLDHVLDDPSRIGDLPVWPPAEASVWWCIERS